MRDLKRVCGLFLEVCYRGITKSGIILQILSYVGGDMKNFYVSFNQCTVYGTASTILFFYFYSIIFKNMLFKFLIKNQ